MHSKVYKLAVFLPHLTKDSDFTFVSKETSADDEETSSNADQPDGPTTSTKETEKVMPYIIPIGPCPCNRTETQNLLDICHVDQPLAASVFSFLGDLAANMSKLGETYDNYDWVLHGAKVKSNNDVIVVVLMGVPKPPQLQAQPQPTQADEISISVDDRRREPQRASRSHRPAPCDARNCRHRASYIPPSHIHSCYIPRTLFQERDTPRTLEDAMNSINAYRALRHDSTDTRRPRYRASSR